MAREWLADAPLPALLRGAWKTYGDAVRGAMAEEGFDDLPRNGAYVVSAIAGSGLSLGQVIGQLGVSKQAAGQLVDTLVVRGYLERSVDPADRRRITVSLTSRGEEAASVSRRAIESVDEAMLEHVSAADLATLRRTLAAVMEAGATVEGK